MGITWQVCLFLINNTSWWGRQAPARGFFEAGTHDLWIPCVNSKTYGEDQGGIWPWLFGAGGCAPAFGAPTKFGGAPTPNWGSSHSTHSCAQLPKYCRLRHVELEVPDRGKEQSRRSWAPMNSLLSGTENCDWLIFYNSLSIGLRTQVSCFPRTFPRLPINSKSHPSKSVLFRYPASGNPALGTMSGVWSHEGVEWVHQTCDRKSTSFRVHAEARVHLHIPQFFT